MINMDDYLHGLTEALKSIGVQQGDILYVSSDITLTLFKAREKIGICGTAEKNKYIDVIIDVLKELVGASGTLLFPVFTWGFCRGEGFDYNKSKGEVGALSNYVLEHRKDFSRTMHPIYSFMVWGKYKDELVGMDNQDGWSEASPFGFLKVHNAKQLLFNIEAYQGLTFGHYVEQYVSVPYRHPKYFFGRYVDANGKSEIRMYSMFVRDLNVEQLCGIHNDFLIEKNVAKKCIWDDNILTVVDLAKAFPVIKDDILYNNGINTLDFRNYDFDWSVPQTVKYEISKIPSKGEII